MNIVVLDTAEQVAEKSLEFLHGPRVALLGGNTFVALARAWVPNVRRRIEAGETFRFFPVDERAVSFDDPASNWRSVYEHLLVPCGLSNQRSQHVTTAAQYQSLLQKEFGTEPVSFDSVFLGMGEDGHIASLFPDSEALHDTESILHDITDSPKPPAKRVTLGLRPIQESATLVTVVLGEGKAEAVRRLMDGDESLPVTRAVYHHKNAIVLLDRAAARDL